MAVSPGSPTTEQRSRADRAWEATKLYLPGSLAAIAAGLLAASSLTPDGHWTQFRWDDVPVDTTLLVSGLILAVPGQVVGAVQLRRVKQRADHARAAAARAVRAEGVVASLACSLLRDLFSILRLDTASRASLFLDTGRDLMLLARYSPNVEYRRSTGRASYDYDHGVLGKAWRVGRAEEKGLPSPGDRRRDHSADPNWIEQQGLRWAVPKEQAAALTMRSRSYAAVRLEQGSHELGVLILEDERRAQDVPRIRAGGPSSISCAALSDATTTELQERLITVLAACQRLDAAALRVAVTATLEDRPAS